MRGNAIVFRGNAIIYVFQMALQGLRKIFLTPGSIIPSLAMLQSYDHIYNPALLIQKA